MKSAFSFFLLLVLTIPVFSQLESISSINNLDGGIHGLDGSADIVSSSDGKFAYSLSWDDDAITIFKISETDSSMQLIGTLWGKDNGFTGFNYVNISPDDKFLYVSSFTNNKVILYARDVLTGLLSYVESYTDPSQGTPMVVKFSPDGKNAYVPSYYDNTLLVYSRNTETGALSYLEKHVDGQNGVNRLKYVKCVEVSPDGKFVYTAAHDDDAITIFSRNTSTGKLTFVKELIDGVNGIAGIGFVEFMEMSDDGKHLYTCSNTNTYLTVFSRNSTTGDLTFVESFGELEEPSDDDLFQLNSPDGLELSKDNKTLFVSDIGTNGVFVFSRNTSSGALTYKSDISYNSRSVFPLDGITDININSVNNDLYAVDRFNNTVSRFVLNATKNLVYKEHFIQGQGGINGIGYCSYIIDDSENNVYVCSYSGGLALFRRHGTDSLSYESALVYDSNKVYAMASVYSAQISPDNQKVYSCGTYGIMSTNKLSSTPDSLKIAHAINSNTVGFEELRGSNTIRISNDGAYLYLISEYLDYALMVFRIEGDSLIMHQLIKTDSLGIESLWGAKLMEMTPDNKYIYTKAEWNKIVSFKRDENTGKLEYIEQLTSGEDGISGISGQGDFLISNDNKFLYCVATGSDMLTLFSINPENGILSQLAAIPADSLGGSSCENYSLMDITADNQFIYVKSDNNYLKIFRRDIETGMLTYVKEMLGFNYSTFRLSKDNKLLYAAKGSNFTAFKLTADAALLELGSDIFMQSGDTIWLSINADFTQFKWSTGDTINTTIPVTVEGKYFVTVTDSDGIVNSDTIYVMIDNNIPDIEIDSVEKSDIMDCLSDDAGSIKVIASGGVGELSYSIDGGINYQQSNEFPNLAEGEYTVTVRDSTGQTEITVTITITDERQIYRHTLFVNTCESYTWIDGVTYTESNFTATHTLTNTNGCDSIVTLNLTILENTTGTDVQTAYGSFTWIDGVTYYESDTTATHTLTNMFGCDSVVTLNLTIVESEENIFVVDSTIDVNCYGDASGSIILFVEGGQTPYNFNWSNSSKEQNQKDLAAGIYTVTVSDKSGQSITKELAITQPDSVLSLTAISTNVLCKGENTGSIVLDVAGGSEPYSYKWSNGFEGKDQLKAIAKDYWVIVTDKNGCYNYSKYSITEPATRFNVSGLTINDGCDENASGKIYLNITGGIEPYTYSWSNGSFDQNQTDLSAGYYQVTVSDGNKCSSTWQTTLKVKAKANLSGVAKHSGFIEANAALVSLFKVQANKYNLISEIGLEVNGLFEFANLLNGQYIVCVHPDSTIEMEYQDIMKSYYDNEYNWKNAQLISLGCEDSISLVVNMLEDISSTVGRGTISGKITENIGGLKSTFPPMGNVDVMLIDEISDNPVAFTQTDNSGLFVFSNVNTGNYSLYVDIIGITQKSTYQIAIINPNEVHENLDFEVDLIQDFDIVTKAISSGNIESNAIENDLIVFPNPVKTYLSLRSAFMREKEVEITLFTLSGILLKMLKASQSETASGVLRLDLSDIAPGNYIIKMECNQTFYFKSIVVME
ncbi:MAG: beta-propeller fold lactonase family protein [Salinivirgaceae bacterium]|nr:beta-propeller fold lactonase family protein [Salinivirgaceae bacterium]